MSQRQGLATLDAPVVDQERLRPMTGVAKPEPELSLWQQFNTTALNAAGNSEMHQAERDDALADGYAGLVASLRKRGVDTSRMAWTPLPFAKPIYDPDAIWSAVATARAQEPKAFSDVPGDLGAFKQRITAPIDAKYAPAERIEQRSGWVPWLAGQFLGGASDPVNQIGMLTGAGEAKTLLGGAMRAAGTNAYLTAVTEPQKIVQRAQVGETTKPGEVIGDIASSAAIGGVLHVGLGGLGKLGGSVWGETARAAETAIGPERMTETERAAVDTLHRADEVAATSPYTPGAGTDMHFARMDAAERALDRPPAPTPTPAPAAPPRFDEQGYAWRVAQVESNGNYKAQAEGTSAYGMYQITRPTWLRLAADDPKMFGGLSDEAKWNMRTNPALQERMFKRLVDEQRDALARIGAPETYGNMYLLHFAGEGGAGKILRAPPETPIGELLSAKAIEANPFLKGKTAGEVIAWAHAKMHDSEHSGAVLRRDIFDSDQEWAMAQRAADDAAHAFDLAQRDAEAASRPPTVDAADPLRPPGAADDIGDPNSWGLDDVAATDSRPVGNDWEPDPEGQALRAQSLADERRRWLEAIDQLKATGDGEAAGVLFHPETGPIDVKWGVPGDPANNFRGGYGLAHVLAKHPEMEKVLADLPAMIRSMTVKQRRPERTVLESADHEASIALTWHGADQRWLVTAFEKGREAAPDGPNSEREPIGGGSGSSRPEAAGDVVRVPMARKGALNEVPRETFADDVPRAEPEGFDHPDDVAAQRQIDSLEHDLRLQAEAEPDATFRIDEDAPERTIGEILADLDADEAAIKTAKDCL